MFKSLRLENFKCYKGPTGDIPLRPLTLIIGPNNAGKSTLIQAILLFKQTLYDKSNSALVTTGPLVDLGGFYDILYGGHAATSHTFSIGLTRDEPDEISIRRNTSSEEKTAVLANNVDVTFGFNSHTQEINVCACTLKREEEIIIASHKHNKEWEAKGIAKAAHDKLVLEYRHFFPMLVPKALKEGRKLDMRGLRGAQVIASQLGAHSWVWEILLRALYHVSPVRARLPWSIRIGQGIFEIGSAGENLLQILAKKDAVPGKNTNLLGLVDNWISKRFEMLSKLRMKSSDKAGMEQSLIGDEIKGTKGINLAAMGEGMAQVLPIIAQTEGTNKRECLLIEQPELHLHPRAQADLADLFMENAVQHRQFIIETHSEHLLLRIRRRIAEKKYKHITPENVAILCVEKKGGYSKVSELKLNGQGHFENWPKGFFDEAYQEAMAMAIAAGKQKKDA
ncbi:MAG: DUF3696 domain-containing protein [Thermoguttaceae bacterium]|jgi:predicted ATPase/uncharacterized protein YneR